MLGFTSSTMKAFSPSIRRHPAWEKNAGTSMDHTFGTAADMVVDMAADSCIGQIANLASLRAVNYHNHRIAPSASPAFAQNDAGPVHHLQGRMEMCLTLRSDLHQQHHLLALYMVPAAVALSMYLPAGALAFGASAFDALAFDASAFDATTFDDARLMATRTMWHHWHLRHYMNRWRWWCWFGYWWWRWWWRRWWLNLNWWYNRMFNLWHD